MGQPHRCAAPSLYEFILNAAEASASPVLINTTDESLLEFIDEGCGMSDSVMNSSLLKLGKDDVVEHGFTSQYGMGFKHAMAHLGKETVVFSKTAEGFVIQQR